METSKLKQCSVLYGTLLLLFTVYLLLDTFVIPRRLRPAEPLPEQDGASAQVTVLLPEDDPANYDYFDPDIRIRLDYYREYGTDIYVADVRVSSVDYLKTAFAEDVYGKNVRAPVSEMAEANGAILAINGDYYGAREDGYVLRNGVLYRDRAQKDCTDLVILSDGDFLIAEENEWDAEELADLGAWQIFSFGPALVEDGAVTVGKKAEVLHSLASNPRTAIGMIEPLHYLFVVSDGRTEESDGLSLYELGCFLQSLGAKTAYNMDGGGSSTIVFRGRVLNVPTSDGITIEERSVSDLVYVGQ